MGLTQRDAQKLVDSIRNAKIGAATIARRVNHGSGSHTEDAAFLGGLEAVLELFLRTQGCADAAAQLSDALNRPPTRAEMAVRNAQINGYRPNKAAGAVERAHEIGVKP